MISKIECSMLSDEPYPADNQGLVMDIRECHYRTKTSELPAIKEDMTRGNPPLVISSLGS
ncbi:hypothetical protein [Echinicola pacifica]|uniref:hypothetical protein n=1 Tax=Echinicola pacifica TaxID=346377 RepID=UPI00035FFC45|nr:hypothetical protein [Echinicola pacifica]